MPRSRPHAVTTVSASLGPGSGEVAVNWGAVSDADGYKILRSTSANGLFKQTGKLNVITGVTSAAAGVVNIWSYQHSYVPAKKMSGRDTSKSFEYVETIGSGKRCFKVVAFNTAGDSAASKVVCASPP
jgi:hypothetical protein